MHVHIWTIVNLFHLYAGFVLCVSAHGAMSSEAGTVSSQRANPKQPTPPAELSKVPLSQVDLTTERSPSPVDLTGLTHHPVNVAPSPPPPFDVTPPPPSPVDVTPPPPSPVDVTPPSPSPLSAVSCCKGNSDTRNQKGTKDGHSLFRSLDSMTPVLPGEAEKGVEISPLGTEETGL